MQTIAEILAQELGASPVHVQNVIDLLDEGNTIPFIARYRKELHGSHGRHRPAEAGGPAATICGIWTSGGRR